MARRLFLFASYDRDAVIDDYVVYYLRALAELGDVIFWMDNDAPSQELDKVRPYTIYAQAQKHSSYDFGSYKRLYQWADVQGILGNYDFLYFCNDSCFGPFRPLGAALENMEAKSADWFGFVVDRGFVTGIGFIQSWFVGMTSRVFLANWFKLFINGITQESEKLNYVYKYEIFSSWMSKIFGASSFGCFECGVEVYNQCDELLAAGMPFIKRLGYLDKKTSREEGFVPRARALLMLEPQQREMVMKYIRRIDSGMVWFVMHPRICSFVYKILRIRIRSTGSKEFVIRVLGIPVFYKSKKTPAQAGILFNE